ncbi:MAG: hypothetical protein WCK49_05200 [Myxococcaceae bacterium]
MRISIDLRQRAFQAYENAAGTLREIASRFLIGEASLKRFLRLKRETGDVRSGKRHGGGPVPIIPGPDLQKLAEVVAQKPDRTIKEFREECYRQTGVKASHATERDSEKNRLRREVFEEEIAEVAPEKRVYLDEAGSNLAMTRRYARSCEGKRVYCKRPGSRGGNISMVGAIR